MLQVMHICYKVLFSMFYLFFRDVRYKCVYLDVTYIPHICYKCFIWILRMFYNVFHVFLQVFQMHVSSVSSAFRHMLHLDVSKVDQVLHLHLHFLLNSLGVSSSQGRLVSATPPPLLDAGDV
jgi:hypothetical protein